MKRSFTVVIERDTKGWLFASVPTLRGCHTQARSFDELDFRIREVIALCLENEETTEALEFVGVHQVLMDA
jgi:predicted RNase H-like HicB family nuclease